MHYNFFKGSFTDKDLVLLVVTPPISFDKWLQLNLYNYTNKPMVRQILELPLSNISFMPALKDHQSWGLSCSIFYSAILDGIYFNQTDKALTTIINTNEFSRSTRDLLECIFSSTAFAQFNVPILGDAFDFINVRQQKLGGMINLFIPVTDLFSLYFQTPFLYHINHINADSETREKLTDEIGTLFFKNAKTDDAKSDPSNDFIKENFVFDYFGIESFLLGIFFHKSYNDNCLLEAKSGFLIPGYTFNEGLIGSDLRSEYYKVNNFSLMNFAKKIIHEQKISPNNYQDLMVFFQSLCKTVSNASFATRPEDLPWKIFGEINFTAPLVNGITLSWGNKMYLVFPNKTIQYGYIPSDTTLFLDSYDDITEKKATQTLTLFDAQFLKRTIMQPFHAYTGTGCDFDSNITIRSFTDRYSALIGLNIWLSSGRSTALQGLFYNVMNTYLSPNDPLIFTQKPYAGQLKFFSIIELLNLFSDSEFFLNLKGEITLWANGIGYENGIMLEFIIKF